MAQHKHVTLNANLIPGGTLGGGWRRSEHPAEYFIDIDHYIDFARVAERGKLDAVFLADVIGFGSAKGLGGKGWHQPDRFLDPLIAQAIISVHTERIGLIATATTSYNDPYVLARQFASLSAVSRGRIAWNFVVTSGDDSVAQNFSQQSSLPKVKRYERALEFLQVVTQLWESWQPGALAADKASGLYVDPARLRTIDFEGAHFQVRGPLKAPPLAHGRPLLVQAGASTAGVETAGRFADAVYSAHSTLEDARARRRELRTLAERNGRGADAIKLLPGLVAVIGSTDEEARRREQELIDLTPDRVQLENLANWLGVAVDALELDRPLPWDAIEEELPELGSRGQRTLLLEKVRRDGGTARDAARTLASGNLHVKAVGGPETVADLIQQWFEAGAVDGFNVLFDDLPDGLEVFVDEVVPLLRNRGLFRHDYESTTLRGHYGLDQPA